MRAGKHDLRTDLDVELEGQWLAVVELQLVDMRLRRDLEVLAVHNFLEGLLNQRLDHLLADGILEPLLDQLRRRFAGPKAGKSHSRRVASCRLLLCLAHRLDRHLHFEQALGSVAFLRGDLDIHARKLTGSHINAPVRGERSWSAREPRATSYKMPARAREARASAGAGTRTRKPCGTGS